MKNEISITQQIILFLLLVFIVVPTILALMIGGIYFLAVIVGLGDLLALGIVTILMAIIGIVFENLGKL